MRLLIKSLLFTIIVPGTVAGFLPAFFVRGELAGPFLLAAPFFAIGGAVYAWTVWDFAVRGRGTPAPLDSPKRLVSVGLYRYVRNPMYLGVLCVILGWAAWYHSLELLLYLALVWLCFHVFTVFYEEPHLRRLFGENYLDYCRRAGRWMPHLPGKYDRNQ